MLRLTPNTPYGCLRCQLSTVNCSDMPRPNYGNAVKQRATQFFTVLVDYANDELDCDERHLAQLQQEIQLHWQTEKRCVVRTKVRYLEQLTKLAGLTLSSEQIKESIKCLTDFLGVVEDNRASKGGSETWHFTLNLWHDRSDRVANIRRFETEWDARKSPQSDRADVQIAIPTDRWLELMRSSLMTQQYHRVTTNSLMGEDRLKFSLDRVYVPLKLVKRQRVTIFDILEENDDDGEEIGPNANAVDEEAALTVEGLLAHLLTNFAPNRVAIVGEPGAGKTTCLQKLAAELLDRQLLPIWISLADLQGETLERYLLQDWLKIATCQLAIDPKLQQDLAAQFESGRVWLLLDAVDEMAFDPSTALTNLARQFQGWIGGAHIILTCRSNVWDSGKNALENFTTYCNLSLSNGDSGAICGKAIPSENRVRQFIEGWFTSHPNLGEQLILELAQPQYQRLRDAVKSPLRLALLCRYWFVAQGKLPSTKASLYQQFTDTIYEWKQDRFPTSLSQRQQLNLGLGKLALQTTIAPQNSTDDRYLVRFRLHQHTVLELIDPDLLELALRLGWLNQVGISATTGGKIYAFYHATFQEYFAARSISDWHYFLTKDRSSQLLIFNPYWHETILFWFGRVDIDPSEKEAFIEALIDVDRNCGGLYAYRVYFLAAAALAEFPESSHSQEIIDRLLRWRFGEFIPAQNIWQFYPLPVQDGARAALRKTDRVMAIAGLETFIQTVTNPFLAWQAAHSLGKVFDPGNPVAIEILTNSIASVNSSDLQIKICESLSKIDPNYNPIAIDTLVDIIHTQKNTSLTRKAAFTLGKLSIDNNPLFELAVTTLVGLIESAQTPTQVLKQRDNQIAALENLRQIAPTHPATQQQFGSDRTLPSSTRNHRKKVVHQRDVSIAITELEQKLATAKNAESQRRYAYQLAKFQPGHPLAVETLLQLMCSIQPPSFYKRTVECLKEAILDEQLALVVTTLKHNIVKIESGDRSAATLECYKLLWYCAEQLPYQQFMDVCDR